MRRLGFVSDAGYRFERGVDFEHAAARRRARDRAHARDLRRAGRTALRCRRSAARARSGSRAAGARSRGCWASTLSTTRRSPTSSCGCASAFERERRRLRRHAAVVPLRSRDRGRLRRGSRAASTATTRSPRSPRARTADAARARGAAGAGDAQAPLVRARLAGSRHVRLRDAALEAALFRTRDAERADRGAESDRDSPRRDAHDAAAGLLEALRTNSSGSARAGARVRDRPRLRDARGEARAAVADRRASPRRRAAEQWGKPARRSISSTSRATSRRWRAPRRLTTERGRASVRCTRAGGARESTAIAIGWIGELHPRLVRQFELPLRAGRCSRWTGAAAGPRPCPLARPVSRQPIVRRDMAVIVDEAVPATAMLDAHSRRRSRRMSSAIAIFDVYRGRRIDPRQKKPCDSGAYAGYCTYFDGRGHRRDRSLRWSHA